MQQARPQKGLIGLALLLGIAGGFVLSQSSEPHYLFVHGSNPIQISEIRSGATRGTVRIYNLQKDWHSVLAEAIEGSPLAVLQEGAFKGVPAKTIVIPREENGRAKLFETPEREITVIKGKFVLGESGAALAREAPGEWAGVRVIEFRRPQIYDAAAEWLQKTLKV